MEQNLTAEELHAKLSEVGGSVQFGDMKITRTVDGFEVDDGHGARVRISEQGFNILSGRVLVASPGGNA